jgi:hypothetical protein
MSLDTEINLWKITVKRAQEVIMFGNQQNRGSEVRGYTFPRTEKRGGKVSTFLLYVFNY